MQMTHRSISTIINDINDSKRRMEITMEKIQAWMKENPLKLNPSKTELQQAPSA
jgi:hypothetical protein